MGAPNKNGIKYTKIMPAEDNPERTLRQIIIMGTNTQLVSESSPKVEKKTPIFLSSRFCENVFALVIYFYLFIFFWQIHKSSSLGTGTGPLYFHSGPANSRNASRLPWPLLPVVI